LFHWSILNCTIQVAWWSFCCEIWKDGKESSTTVPPEVLIYVTKTVGNIMQLNTLYVHHTLNWSRLSIKWTMFLRSYLYKYRHVPSIHLFNKNLDQNVFSFLFRGWFQLSLSPNC
jgi:hypothetical protein